MHNNFEDWKRLVNKAVVIQTGLSVDDLPDCSYYEWYEQGVSPTTAAKRALKSALSY